MPKNETKKEEQAKKEELKWRLFCPACTGRAKYAAEPYIFHSIVCQNCGMVVLYDPAYWFELSQEEFTKVNYGSN